MKVHHQRRLDADLFLTTMQLVHNHLRVEMRQSQAVPEEGANPERTLAPNISEQSQLCLDA